MIIDSKGKLFGKISIVDILIVLLVLGAIAGVTYKFTKSKTIFTQKDTLTIKYFAEESPDFAANSIKVGDPSRELIQNAYFGKVTNIKLDTSVAYAEDAQGNFHKSGKDGYRSVELTIEGYGVFANDGVTIDNSQYFIGATTQLRVGNATFYGKIMDIQKKE